MSPKGLFKLSFGVLLLCFVLALVWLPNGSDFRDKAPLRTSLMRAQEEGGKLEGKLRYQFVSLNKISPAFRHAVIVAEDANFPSHSGFDVGEMYHALIEALQRIRLPRGASTISQQTAKNLYLSNRWNPFRKLIEAIITFKMESALSKRRILELYLNIAELGPGVFGAEAASQYWFSKSAAALSSNEAARLAAILPAPNGSMNPRKYPRRVARRQELILRRMSMSRLSPGL